MQVLYVICVLQIFSVSLWLVFSTGQKFLMLIKFNLSVFTFMDHTCGGVYKDSSLNWNSHRFLSYFYGFAFSIWVIIQFDFIFVKNVRSVSGFFFFFAYEHPVVPAPCVEEIVLSLFGSLALLLKISWVCFSGSVSEPSVLLQGSLWLFFYFVLATLTAVSVFSF